MRTGDGQARARLTAWIAFACVVLWQLVALIVDLDPVGRVWLVDVPAYLLPMAVAVVLVARLALGSLGSGLEHRFWGLLLLALLPLLIAESYWSVYVVTVDSRGPIDSRFVLAMHLLGEALFLALVLRMARYAAQSVIARMRFYIDVASVLVVLWPIVYLTWTLPMIGKSGGHAIASLGAIYPLVGGLVIIETFAVAFSRRVRRAAWERIVAIALMLCGLGLVANPALNAMARAGDERGLELIAALGAVEVALLCVGIAYRVEGSPDESGFELWELPEPLEPRRLRHLPVAISLSLVPLGVLAVTHADTAAGGPLLYANVALAVLLALRSLIAAIERARARALAVTDPETGVFERGVLASRLQELTEDALDSGHPFSLVVFDVSDLANLAEARPGDGRVGRELVDVIRAQSEDNVDVYRLGEDRYAVLWEGVTTSDAASFALRVWLSFVKERPAELPDLSTGFAAGVAGFPMHAFDPDGVLAAAELAVNIARGREEEPVAVYDDSVEVLSADERRTRERMRALRSTVRALAEAVDARDPATRDHSANVAELATALAQMLDLSDRQVQIIGLGALMHDVGKIGVHDHVLLKSGPLDEEERAEVEEHAVLGERILAPALLDDILPLVRWHHERWDGTGYPDGLMGAQIPIEARVLAVCDAFETLTTGRPYREALSTPDALAEIEACAGSQFDPDVAAAFVRMVEGLTGAHTGKPAQ